MTFSVHFSILFFDKVPSFPMQILKFPLHFYNEIDMINRSIVWNGKNNHKKCSSYEVGGVMQTKKVGWFGVEKS